MIHPDKITSFKNPLVRNILDLRERKIREKTGLMIVEGYREVLRAKEAHVQFKELYISPELFVYPETQKLVEEVASDQVFDLTEPIFSKISFGERREGILAICRQPKFDLKSISLSETSTLLVVEGIEKPGNLGAILRTCDAAGIDAVILCQSAIDKYNPNVVRSSLGTVFSVKTIEAASNDILEYLHKNNFKITAADTHSSQNYWQEDFHLRTAFILGSEHKGLSDFWIKNSGSRIRIPMQGRADLLNVSVAAAILTYEAYRQRQQ